MAREPMEFEDLFKTWAEREPGTSAEVAAGQVLQRLAERPSRRPRPFWLWANAAASLVLALVLTVRFAPTLTPSTSPDFVIDPAAESQPIDPLAIPDGVVLMWLDAETPLYLTMDIPAGEKSS